MCLSQTVFLPGGEHPGFSPPHLSASVFEDSVRFRCQCLRDQRVLPACPSQRDMTAVCAGHLGCSQLRDGGQLPVGSPCHVHVHLGQTLGQVAVTLHLGEPGGTGARRSAQTLTHFNTAGRKICVDFSLEHKHFGLCIMTCLHHCSSYRMYQPVSPVTISLAFLSLSFTFNFQKAVFSLTTNTGYYFSQIIEEGCSQDRTGSRVEIP